MDKVTSMPKTDTFRFRINPEIRREIEEIYSQSGLTLTQAINIFIQTMYMAYKHHTQVW